MHALLNQNQADEWNAWCVKNTKVFREPHWKDCVSCLAASFSLVVSEDPADANARCENIYKDFSDCFLELGERMNNYQENVTSEKGVAAVCRWWWLIGVCQLTGLVCIWHELISAQTTERTGIKLHSAKCCRDKAQISEGEQRKAAETLSCPFK